MYSYGKYTSSPSKLNLQPAPRSPPDDEATTRGSNRTSYQLCRSRAALRVSATPDRSRPFGRVWHFVGNFSRSPKGPTCRRRCTRPPNVVSIDGERGSRWPWSRMAMAPSPHHRLRMRHGANHRFNWTGFSEQKRRHEAPGGSVPGAIAMEHGRCSSRCCGRAEPGRGHYQEAYSVSIVGEGVCESGSPRGRQNPCNQNGCTGSAARRPSAHGPSRRSMVTPHSRAPPLAASAKPLRVTRADAHAASQVGASAPHDSKQWCARQSERRLLVPSVGLGTLPSRPHRAA